MVNVSLPLLTLTPHTEAIIALLSSDSTASKSTSRNPRKDNLLGLNTVTGRANESIHPRVVGGRQQFDKCNTAKPEKSRPEKKLRKARAALDVRRHARDLSVESLKRANPAIDWATAMKKPGSMRWGK